MHAMAVGSNRHNSIAFSCMLSLGNQLRGKSCEPFNNDTKVKIEFSDHTRFYYPDAMVVCQKNPDSDHFQTQPVVIVEVLSESTRRTDIGEKKDAYLSIPSLKVLMLVETDSPKVTVYRRKSGGGFSSELHVGLDAIISLSEVEAELPLRELVERVEW